MAAACSRVVRLGRFRGQFVALLLALLGAAAPTGAIAQEPGASTDAHKIYEQRCMRCHTMHGADFARQKLTLAGHGNLLVARTGAAIAALLKRHHGVEMTESEQAALFELFEDGISRKGVFQHRCAVCHGRASDFARAKLTLTNGGLAIRGSGTDVRTFLKGHHEATPEDIDVIIEALTAHLQGTP